MTGPTLARDPEELGAVVTAWRRAGESVALVPTMGALHRGHLALVAAAHRLADRTVLSIFVNPTQFGPAEDFARYPRTFEADRALFETAGGDCVYAPSAPVMYPDGFATSIVPSGPALAGLEDAARPTHFAGVATVVVKLLAQGRPDIALFGEKDWQQLKVVERVVADLDLGVRIVGVPTWREPDGLALSSRNVYLAPDARGRAPRLHAALAHAAEAIGQGEESAGVLRHAREKLAAEGFALDYLELRDAATLAAPVAGRARRLLVAARLGPTRLIDNLGLP